MSVVVALLAVVVALLAVVVVGLLRTNAEILRALDRLGEPVGGDVPAGSGVGTRVGGQPAAAARTGRAAADLAGATLDGGQQVLRVAGVGHDTLLLFLSSGCLTCRAFWDALREQPRLGLPSRVRVVVVTKDLAEESPSELAGLVPAHGATTLASSAAWADLEVPGSPYVVLVDGASGTVVGEGTGASWAQVGGMLAQASGDLVYAGGQADRTRKARRDMATERDTDAELLAAGIRPGDPTLYQSTTTDGASTGEDGDA